MLERAINLEREALGLYSSVQPDRISVVRNLGRWTCELSDHSDDVCLMDRYDKDVFQLCPPGQPVRGEALEAVAVLLYVRCTLAGDVESLKEAIRLETEVLELYPPSHDDRADTISIF